MPFAPVRHRLSPTSQKMLGANIRTSRQRAGLTQQQLAEAVTVDPRALQDMEYGKQGVSLALFLAIARALKVSPVRLLKGVVASRS
jgi:transcriptional regulator with XRE-family HTH domain